MCKVSMFACKYVCRVVGEVGCIYMLPVNLDNTGEPQTTIFGSWIIIFIYFCRNKGFLWMPKLMSQGT